MESGDVVSLRETTSHIRGRVERASTTNRSTVVFTARTRRERAELRPEGGDATVTTHLEENHASKRRFSLGTVDVCGAVCKGLEWAGTSGLYVTGRT